MNGRVSPRKRVRWSAMEDRHQVSATFDYVLAADGVAA